MFTDYANAFVPEPFRILGLRLKPFSLGHYLLLRRFNCAFVQDEPGSATVDDLVLGVLICSLSQSAFLQFIEQKDFLKQMAAWGKKFGSVDFKEKADLFQQYLRQGLSEPDYITLRGTDSPGGDWAQSLKLTLTSKLGHTEAEAMDMPLSQALADYYKLAENEGVIRLITPEERAAGDANAAAFAKLEEEKCPA